MSISAAGAVVVLILLSVGIAPLGAVGLRLVELTLGRRFALTVPERGLLAIYVGGAFFFVIANLPFRVLTPSLVGVCLGLGVAGLLVLWARSGWRPLRWVIDWLTSVQGVVLLGGTLGLLLLETVPVSSLGFPNAYDGAFQSTLVLLIVRHGYLPSTLAPFAHAGVLYPQGTAVWLALPVLLFGWPVQVTPVLLPPLFLSLSVVAAFCWGERISSGSNTPRGVWGLLFAAFFGLVASWPRFYVGGSYDFALSLPLFLLLLGWLRPLLSGPQLASWRTTAALGMLVGVTATLSVVVATMMFALCVAFSLPLLLRGRLAVLRGWTARFLLTLGTALVFVSRSIGSLVVWWHYPEHTLAPVGAPPYTPLSSQAPASLPTVLHELNPFEWLSPKLSPLAALSVESLVLLVAGTVLLAAWCSGRSSQIRSLLGRRVVVDVLLIVFATFAVLAVLLGLDETQLQIQYLAAFSNIDETSILLFIAYEAVALLPLVALLAYRRSPTRSVGPQERTGTSPPQAGRPWSSGRWTGSPGGAWGTSATFAVVLVVAFGGAVTIAEAPGYLHGHVQEFGNVSSSDVSAMDWIGANLPACSRVLVAPGSAAQFLPLFASVQIVFPMDPIPLNLSYNRIVTDLVGSTYTASTRQSLLELGVTEVVATGRTSVTYAPFNMTLLESTTDLSPLFHQGDAAVFEFDPGVTASGCGPD